MLCLLDIYKAFKSKCNLSIGGYFSPKQRWLVIQLLLYLYQVPRGTELES